MSSRLMPPYAGAIALTMEMISSVSLVSRTTGQASTPPNSLNRTALPSMTGRAASGPMSPRPRTAVPSETTATVLAFMVSRWAFWGMSWMAVHTRATPGV
jgi:hypothetical protein